MYPIGHHTHSYMKSTYAALVIALLFVFTSCKKSNSTKEFMKATINGSPFNGKTCFYSDVDNPVNITGGTFTDPVSSFPSFRLGIRNFTGVGTYPVGQYSATEGRGGAALDYAYGHGSSSVSGKIVITSTYPFKGTFDFVFADGTVVADGSFCARKD